MRAAPLRNSTPEGRRPAPPRPVLPSRSEPRRAPRARGGYHPPARRRRGRTRSGPRPLRRRPRRPLSSGRKRPRRHPLPPRRRRRRLTAPAPALGSPTARTRASVERGIGLKGLPARQCGSGPVPRHETRSDKAGTPLQIGILGNAKSDAYRPVDAQFGQIGQYDRGAGPSDPKRLDRQFRPVPRCAVVAPVGRARDCSSGGRFL